MVLVQKSVAHPWMCDVLGHMTTRHYVAMFDDAAYHMLYNVFGWTGSSDDDNKIALICFILSLCALLLILILMVSKKIKGLLFVHSKILGI